MAPPKLKRSVPNYTHPTMYSTQSAISVFVTSTTKRHDSTASSNPPSALRMLPWTGHFKKYHIPITLPKLQPVLNTACWKKVGFDQLALTIYDLLKLHSVSYLIPLIAREVSNKKFTAQQEAIYVVYKV